jgi:hypothetical protein
VATQCEAGATCRGFVCGVGVGWRACVHKGQFGGHPLIGLVILTHLGDPTRRELSDGVIAILRF